MPRRCKADDWLLEPAEMVCEVRGVIRRRRLAPAPTRPTGDSTRRAPAGQAVCRSPSCVRGAAGVGFGVCAHSLCSDSRLLWDCPICGYLTILRVSIVHRETRRTVVYSDLRKAVRDAKAVHDDRISSIDDSSSLSRFASVRAFARPCSFTIRVQGHLTAHRHSVFSHITHIAQLTGHTEHTWDAFLTTNAGHTAHARAIYALYNADI